jgi:dienelactone hydrolase
MRWPARWRRPRRILADVAIAAACLYAALIAYLYAYQVELVFRAPPNGALYMRSLALAPDRLVLGGADGFSTDAWRIRPPAPVLAAVGGASPYWVLYLHGNEASITTSANLRRYDQLRRLGLNVLAVEYPGFGDVGGEASERGMQAAARAGYEHLRRAEGAAAGHIAIYGWSLGTGAAVPLARDVEEAALVLEGGFTSVLARAREEYPVIPIAWLLAHPFRSDEAIAATRSATLVLHSPEDVVIPFHHGEALFARAAEPKRLVRLAGGHIFPNAADADRYAGGIHAFLTEVVGWRLHQPPRSAGAAVARALADQGLEAALEAWRAALREGEPAWSLAEYELQYVARQATLRDRHAAAIALFRANRDRFPDSPLAWYELGRGLAAAGHHDDARRAFTRSIALEPASRNPSHAARRALD